MRHWHRFSFCFLVTAALAVALALIAPGGRGLLAADGIIYVDADATAGAKAGSSWADAYTDFQAALNAAESGQQIWVAEGTYTPTQEFAPGDPRSASFKMKNGVAIYGGFDPSVGDTEWADRDWKANPTTFSGDIGIAYDTSDNSYHVFYHPVDTALDGSAVLDGITITDGNANGDQYPHQSGAGMYNYGSSPTLVNCTFSGNSAIVGGGLYCRGSSSMVTGCTFSGNSADYGGGMAIRSGSTAALVNCTFSNNSAVFDGGGMYTGTDALPTMTNCAFSSNSANYGGGISNHGSSPALTNCTFSSNSANYGGGMANWSVSLASTNCTFSSNSASYGGGMYNGYSSLTLTNCVFSGNSAQGGGGLANESSSPVLTNCTFSGNSAVTGGGMFNYDASSPTLTNCILWADSPVEVHNDDTSSMPIITHSSVQGGYPGEGNINADPLFLDAANDYHLGRGSPCIDAGNNAAPNLPPYDFEGDTRRVDGDRDGTATVDMGVDEALLRIHLPVVLKGY